jgi:TolB protein
LTYIGNYNDSPDWSPKGSNIVFVSRVRGRFNICTIDVTGDNFRVLTNKGGNENPHWSPDGNHIIFSSTRTGSKEIFIMDRFGNEQKRLTTGGGNSNPAWSGYKR